MTFGTVRTSPVGELLLLRSLLEPHQAKFRAVWANPSMHQGVTFFMFKNQGGNMGEGTAWKREEQRRKP